MHVRLHALIPLAAVLAVALSCGGRGGPEPSSALPSPGPGIGGGSPGLAVEPGPPTPTGQTSPVSLPTRQLEFRVHVPDNHPPGGRVVLMTMPPGNVASLARIELEPAGEGVYSGFATVERGALLRYTYDRWDGADIAGWDASRETIEGAYSFINRFVLVTEDLGIVEDTVALWRDLRGPKHSGTVSGTVVDAVSGDPVMDATVSVSGIHTATDWRGRFAVDNLPDGRHRAVVFTTLGDYRPQQVAFEIEHGGAADLALRLSPAKRVPVTFEVALPENTPPDATIAISGNLWQLGGRLGGYPFQPDALALPALGRVAPDRAAGAFDLYEGTYVNYTYTLRSVAEGADRDDSGPVYRSFIVTAGQTLRSDAVSYWGNPSWPLVTLRVRVPPNTTPGVPVALVTGPAAWMSPAGPNEWVGYVLNNPPGAEFEFGINLGGDQNGQDGSPGTRDGRRSFVVPDRDAEIAIEVTKWAALPDPAARRHDGSLEVTFRVSVPPETPPGASIRLVGNRAAVAGGVAMTQRPDNPWLYEATVTFAHDGDLAYRYELEGVGESTGSYRVFTGFDGQVANDWVGRWGGMAREDAAARAGWRSGIYPPDFWSQSFIDTSESAFSRLRDVAGGEWVALSSVWSFGALQPEPVLEPRPVRAWSVLTPLEDIKAQAALAHAAGLKVLLAPQQNPEVWPDWTSPGANVRDRAWWEAWLGEAEKQWMWNAQVADEIGAEMLLLPGPVFHVFPSVAQFDGDPFQGEFDSRVADLVQEVRGVYGGSILISGGNREFDFPGLADLRGVTTYDLGIPQLPDDATVGQWKAAYSAGFEAAVDPIHERWDGPVLFYTVHGPPTGSALDNAGPPAGDPFGEHVQANRLEAIYQLIAERPWIQGAFSWSYDYIDAPQRLSDGVRGRLGEAVQAKWYDLLSGD